MTPGEQHQVDAFERLVLRMEQSRFIQSIKSQGTSWGMDVRPDGQVDWRTPAFDMEDFRAFLTAFRQVAMSEQEPTYFFKVRNLAAKLASDEGRASLADLHKRISPILAGRYSAVQLGVEHGKRQYTSHQIVDTIVNGSVFHSDRDHAQAVADLESTKPAWLYIGVALDEFILPVYNASVRLLLICRAEGFASPSDP